MFKRKKKKEKSGLELALKHINNSLKFLIMHTACCTFGILATSKLIYTIFTKKLLDTEPNITMLRLTLLCFIIAMLLIQIIKLYKYLKYTYEISMTDLAILLNERKRRLNYVEKFGSIIPKDDSKKTIH